jgi:hypothetical protein
MVKIILFSLLLTFTVHSSSATQEKKLSTKELMQKFLEKLTELKTYFVSEEKFLDPKNAATISEKLKEFADLTKQTRHNPLLGTENFKFSRNILENHMVEIERVFRQGNKAYARWQLTSTISVCMSCHTQIPSKSRAFTDFANDKIFSNALDRAEFLFATRSFDQAALLYQQIVEKYPSNKEKPSTVDAALERLVAYYSRITKDPDGAIKQFSLYEQNKALPSFVRPKIDLWIKQFTKWKNEPALNPQKMSDEDLQKYVTKNVESADLVTNLHLSGLLYEFLISHNKTKIEPFILYWLSMCEAAIGHSYIYSLGTLYLRECVEKFPTDAMAPKCYDEYVNQITLGYTGSMGTSIPSEVTKDFEELKKLLPNLKNKKEALP